MNIFLDFETFSEADIKKTGAWEYSKHPSTEIMCMAWSMGKDTYIWVPDESDPPGFLKYMDEETIFCAHNAAFERAIWTHICVRQLGWPDIPLSQWRCTAARVAAMGLPRSLAEAAQALGLADVAKKDKAGHRVMMRLCKPRKPTKLNRDVRWTPKKVPHDFATLYAYCKQDVIAEMALHHATPPLGPQEELVWQLDQRINERGIPIDTPSCRAAIGLLEDWKIKLNDRLAEITDGQVASSKQQKKFLTWFRDQGLKIDDIAAGTIARQLKKPHPPEVLEALEIRRLLGPSATAKFQAMTDNASLDGRVRGSHLYHGAATGRWASRGVQFQNAKRGYSCPDEQEKAIAAIRGGLTAVERMGTVGEVLGDALRGMVQSQRSKLLVADYAQIECRVLAWQAQEKWLLDSFRNGEDVYVKLAAKIYSAPESKVTAEQRRLGKTAELGLGYCMGPETFEAQCKRYGIEIDPELALHVHQTYKETHEAIKIYWRALYTAACNAVARRRGTTCGSVLFKKEKRWLRMRLPSGRYISYLDPQVKNVTKEVYVRAREWDQGPFFQKKGKKYTRIPDPAAVPKPYVHRKFEAQELSYMGFGTYTRKWERQISFPGRLVENAIQGIARDFLVHSLFQLDFAGYEPVFHVHDEIICEQDGDQTIDGMLDLMRIVPKWGRGCPIEVTGYAGKRYRKD